MNIADVEAKIRAAVADAKAKGWRIRQGMYHFIPLDSRAQRQCCVLGACVRGSLDSLSESEIRCGAARFLGIDTMDALKIVYGFDNPTYDGTEPYTCLGARLFDLVDT